MDIKKIFYEVLDELEKGHIDAGKIFRMKAGYKPNNEYIPFINIKNEELVIKKLEEQLSYYILKDEEQEKKSEELEKRVKELRRQTLKALGEEIPEEKDNDILIKEVSRKKEIDETKVKSRIAFLLANMSINDFNDIPQYIQKRLDFDQNPLLCNKTIKGVETFNSDLCTKITDYGLETPYCFKTFLISDIGLYELPTISYGISDGICYIYAIQNYNIKKTKIITTIAEKNEKHYQDMIKRKLFKLNSGVASAESLEYEQYKNGESDYYPENISDVTPSFILVLTLFLNEIEKHGINNIKVVPYLPIRYENKICVLAHKTLKYAKENKLNNEEIKKKFLELIYEQRNIQSNMTEKLIRTFYRMNYHFDNINITSLPMELDDCLNIKLNKFEYSNNEILNEIINKSNNKTL